MSESLKQTKHLRKETLATVHVKGCVRYMQGRKPIYKGMFPSRESLQISSHMTLDTIQILLTPKYLYRCSFPHKTTWLVQASINRKVASVVVIDRFQVLGWLKTGIKLLPAEMTWMELKKKKKKKSVKEL